MEAKNKYYEETRLFRALLHKYVKNIVCTYGRELVLRLEEYNLLQNKLNCIESSTATGFVLEEFLVAKLEMYTHSCKDFAFTVERNESATTQVSHDCWAMFKGIKFLINIKVEKESSANDAIAAIGKLYNSYVVQEPEQEKCYIVLKVRYLIREREEKPRHIYIAEQSSYSLEEVDILNGLRQDHRSWSAKKSDTDRAKNGRLIVTPLTQKKFAVPIENISYHNTCKMLEGIVNNTK